MNNIWTIPDVHGRNDVLQPLLKKLFEDEKFDFTQDKLVFLGDMIDRGKDSKGVIQTIKSLVEQHPNNIFALQGNHEELALNACARRTHDDVNLWLMNGGDATIDSYKLARLTEPEDENYHTAPRYAGIYMPYEILEWMSKLPLQLQFDGFFFSHACVPKEEYRSFFNLGHPFKDDELTWTRTRSEDEEFELSRVFDNEVVGVCGHNHALSYKPGPLLEPRFYPHYIFADAGCGCYKKAPLVAIECKTRRVVYEWPIEAQGSTQSGCSTEGCSQMALEWNSVCKDHWLNNPRNY